jgi:hypothetical protein
LAIAISWLNGQPTLEDTPMIEPVINILIAELKSSVKNPKKKEELKKIVLKLFRAIQTAYADDEDFS